ncbi:MAG: twin-arginine translocase TatA/TatE family subunit [Microbacteriaceae bacterium]
MARLFEGPTLIIVLVIILLLFGATRLPALAKSIGQSTKIFRNEIKSDKDTSQVVDVDAPTGTDAQPGTGTPSGSAATPTPTTTPSATNAPGSPDSDKR